MPYTQEELQSLEWYQNLLDQDEQQYLIRREYLLDQTDISGSAYDGSLMARDQTNTILLFEDPYTDELRQDPSTMIVYSTEVNGLRKDEGINNIIDRDFEEL
jgi:hypothetical protein